MFILNFSLLNFFILILIFFLNYKKIINLIFFLFLYFLIHYFQNFLIFVEHIIQNLDCLDRTEIMNKDVYTLGKLNLNLQNYDCVFLDPPFKELKIQILLRIIKDKNILKKDSIILIHRDKNILDVFPEDFRNLITKFYGRSKIIFGKFD